MTKSELKNDTFKQAKLAKTKARRQELAQGRKRVEGCGHSGRNDLLPELELRTYDVSELKPPKNRTRKDDPEHVARLVRSISQYGFTQPPLTREGRVYDGWSRVLAAKELGLDQIPVIECSHLSDAEARALALASNRIGELGEWDLDELRTEFVELIELEIDLDATAFTVEEQDIILLDPLDENDEDLADAVDDSPEVAVTQLGDIWELGKHRVICGSALENATYQALLKDEKVHAVLSDPPYNVEIKGNVSGLGKKVHSEFAMASGELSDEEFVAFLTNALALIASFLTAGAVVFAFMDWRSIHRLYAAGEKAGLTLINLAIWYKQSGSMGSLYRSAHELVAVFCNGKTPRVNNVELGKHGRNRCNVWEAPGANRRGSSANDMLDVHATPKPVSLCEDAILDVTAPGEIVLDAFLGSGTTLIAAEKAKRVCRGIELDPGFVDVAITRWEKLTGKEAVLAETGECFAEVARRRLAQALDKSEHSQLTKESGDDQV
jgi:DNA modification methylase